MSTFEPEAEPDAAAAAAADAEQIQPPPASSSPAPIPVIVEDEAAAAAASLASKTTQGSWTHAALHDTPVMKCARAPTRANKATHVLFQQHLLQDDVEGQARLVEQTAASNPKWNEKKVKDFVDERVRTVLESYLTLQSSSEDKKHASKSRTQVDNDVETRRLYAGKIPMVSPVPNPSMLMPIPGRLYMLVVFRQWTPAHHASTETLSHQLCLWPTFPEGDSGDDKGQMIPIDATYVNPDEGIGHSIAEITCVCVCCLLLFFVVLVALVVVVVVVIATVVVIVDF